MARKVIQDQPGVTLELVDDDVYRVRANGKVIGRAIRDESNRRIWWARKPRRASAHLCYSRRAAVAILLWD